ncbi:MAG TPA: hypothetical protein VN362_07845, partial [Xanthobacteraceae bacterium]|nr:hypothetical protein [Xanthobacteraceae bacterium]
ERLIAAIPSAFSAPSAPDPHELARSLQFELKRVGCFNGEVSGNFNDDTKDRMEPIRQTHLDRCA